MTKKEKVINFWKKLNTPASWIALLVYLLTLTLCPLAVVSIVNNSSHHIYATIGYVICALLFVYTLFLIWSACVHLYWMFKKVPRTKKLHTNLHGKFEFRSILFSGFTLVFNIGYTIFLCIMAIRFSSSWYGALAIYYILLTMASGGILVQNAKNEEKFKDDYDALNRANLGTYLYCGIMLIALAVAFLVSVVQVVVVGAGSRAPLWYFFASGAFAVCRLVMGLINFIRSSRHKDLAARSARYINLTTVFVSLLPLLSGFLTLFPVSLYPNIIYMAIGAVVFCLEFFLGIFMIIHSVAMYKKFKRKVEQEEREKNNQEGYNRDGYYDEYPCV